MRHLAEARDQPLRLVAALAAVGLVLIAQPAGADDPETAIQAADAQISAVANDIPAIERADQTAIAKQQTPQQRIADAQLLMGVKDYERAAEVLSEVLERHKSNPTAVADASHLLGETYFLDKQYLSAKRVFERIVSRSAEAKFRVFHERAVVRLVDIALRIRDYSWLDSVFASIGAAPGSSRLAYAKGKGLYAKGDLVGARAALSQVTADSEYVHQAGYLLGVIAVKEATPAPPADPDIPPPPVPRSQYVRAVEIFRNVTRLPPDTPEHRHVIDLAWLAIGRLHYESNQWTQAVEAYNRIGRGSPEFGVMLYELAWVYVKLGDVVRAQRALEVLSVAEPNSQEVADASLLRADLMLRAGQFDKSLKVYESVKGTYESLRDRVDKFLKSTSDPKVYFEQLSNDQLELFESGALPSVALRWAREGEDGEAALAIIDDIELCRSLIKQSNEIIDKLNAVLTSPNRVRAMPGLKAGSERGLGLLNKVSMARLTLAHGMDDMSASESAQLRQARARRRSLEKRLLLIPVTPADFAKRERDASRQWNRTSQALQRLELEIDTVQATINGLRRMMNDSSQSGVVRTPGQVRQVMSELAEQERNVQYFRQQLAELRKATQAGKVQVGFGDKRFIEDANIRKAFTQALWQEAKLAQAGAGGSALAAYAGRVVPLLQQADSTDARIEQVLSTLQGKVSHRAAQLRAIVQQETVNIVSYSMELETLDSEARLVVGEVARRNFGKVHQRLRNIVLRADVGITEEAWEVREEQLTRVRRLRIERARGEQRLQEELNEVLDDSSGPAAGEDQPDEEEEEKDKEKKK